MTIGKVMSKPRKTLVKPPIIEASPTDQGCAFECKTIVDSLSWIVGCIEGMDFMTGCHETEADYDTIDITHLHVDL